MQRMVLMTTCATDASIDLRYIEPLFGLGPPQVSREWLAPWVPDRQLALFAVAWFAHAVPREGLAVYLEASTAPCLADLRRGLRLLDEVEVAEAIEMLAEQARPSPGVLAAVERRIPSDLYDRVVAHARTHATEMVPLDGPLALLAFAPAGWN